MKRICKTQAYPRSDEIQGYNNTDNDSNIINKIMGRGENNAKQLFGIYSKLSLFNLLMLLGHGLLLI